MPSPCDAIVIGAGHNGLTCACYLARAGLSLHASGTQRTPPLLLELGRTIPRKYIRHDVAVIEAR